MITHLTPDLARKLDYVQEWTDIGLCTEPADREAAEAAIALMYRCGGLAPPEKIVWCDSPLSMSLTAAILSHNVEPSVRAGVWGSVGDSVWANVEASRLRYMSSMMIEGMDVPLIMRFKGPGTLDALISALAVHRFHVWPDQESPTR